MYLNGHPARPVFIEDMGKIMVSEFPCAFCFQPFSYCQVSGCCHGFLPDVFRFEPENRFQGDSYGKIRKEK